LRVTGPRPNMRTRFAQTSPIRRQSVAVQFRTPAMEIGTQIGVDTSAVATQIDYQAGFDNFGLPPNLEVAAIIKATRHRGVTESWVTQELELTYHAERGRRFTSTEKSNVDAVVRAITVVRQDERRTIRSDFSQMMRGESTVSQEQPTGSFSGEPLLSIHLPEPSVGKVEEGCGEASSGDTKKNSTPGAPHSQSKADQGDPYDNW